MTASPPALGNSAAALAGRFLLCHLGAESYAIPVLKVREIIRLTDITPIPQMPVFIKGVINLRGKIVPVVDLRLRFGMEAFVAAVTTCIVVVQTTVQTGMSGYLGLIVDGVEEVFSIAQHEIERTPEFGACVDKVFLPAVARIKGKVTALVDIEQVLNARSLPGAAESPLKDGRNESF